ncbi:MAG: hypothetical protein JNM27_16215 [Leptospirales bacterium]|nr:hypothetical protein [Leptospirales bacterium]
MTVLSDLRALYSDWSGALQDFLSRPFVSSRELILSSHMILLLHIPIFSVLSPLPWIFGTRFSPSMRLILPLAIPTLVILLAMVYDRILLNEKGPVLEVPGRERPENGMLFCALPACSCGLFFLLHPIIGLLMSVLAASYSILLFVRASISLWNLPVEKAVFRLAGALFFILIPSVLVVLAFNVVTSFKILGRLFT